MSTPVLELRGVSKAFGGIRVASDVNMAIMPGEVVGLIGPNGAGKTTLFNLVTGQVRPDSGTVTVGGVDVTERSVQERARLGVSRTWQNVRLFPSLSVLDNLLVADRHYPGASLFNVLFRAGRVAHHRADSLAAARGVLATVGLEGSEDVPASELPYGQQKLVAIGRALMNKGSCLLLDEPMSGIEGMTYATIKDVIRRLSSDGVGICIVEHNISFISDLCDRAMFLSLGEVLAEGSMASLMARSDLADVYFGS